MIHGRGIDHKENEIGSRYKVNGCNFQSQNCGGMAKWVGVLIPIRGGKGRLLNSMELWK